MRTVRVNLGDRSYPIFLGESTLSKIGELLRTLGLGKRVGIITNPVVEKLFSKTVETSLRSGGYQVTRVVIPEGEEHKNPQSLWAIYDQLIAERFERGSWLLALGGGVVGDIAGFAAATIFRGIPYVQVPTTLLAQVDSSVGGKTGINHPEGKNLIGAFYQPRAVVIDVAALETLPKRELSAGLAEVIKYGIIEDPALFSQLEATSDRLLALDRTLLEEVVAASCTIKARVVEKDEREDDYRSVLNFGHTIGHALESVTGYESYLHGEAVGIGMVQASGISLRLGYCDHKSFQRIRGLVEKLGLPTGLPSGISPHELVKRVEVDKKATGGKVKFICCQGIGKTVFHWLSPQELLAHLEASG